MEQDFNKQIFTPKETPTLDDVLNTEQTSPENVGVNNEVKDEIHIFRSPNTLEIEEVEDTPSEPILITIDDQIITNKKNRIDFQGYELDNVSEADTDNDVPTIKQVKEIAEQIDSDKQDKLTAGENITITSDNVISAVDTTYSAGSGLNLTDTTFSVGSKAIETGMIDDGAVSNDKLAENAVTTSEIADEAITTAKIGDIQITNEKIASNAVTSDKIAADSITPAKIDWSKITRTDISSTKTNKVNSITRALTYKFGKLMRVNIVCAINGDGALFNIGEELNETTELSCVSNSRNTTRVTLDTNGNVSVATFASYPQDIYIQGMFFIK